MILLSSVSNGLAPDQDQRSVGSDLGPNLLQRLSAYDKVFGICSIDKQYL